MSIQNTTNKRKFSQLRHSLRRLSDELRQLINPSFSNKPVIKGSVYELKRKCGKPGCKCAQGQLHSRMVVSASEKGKTILRVIPNGFLVEVQATAVGKDLFEVPAHLAEGEAVGSNLSGHQFITHGLEFTEAEAVV